MTTYVIVIETAILGPPNAGKSSWFNVLAAREAAIVPSVAITAFDILGMRCQVRSTI
jgi:tRNA U34 5-carboxymethylaminomethyl modifying GTPase MnmE/TrmE